MKRPMIGTGTAFRTTLLACLLAVGCGGGGGTPDGTGGVIVPGLTATFVGDAPMGTQAGMVAGTSTGTDGDFAVDIRVNDISNLLAVSFHLTFENASATFLGVDLDAGSDLGDNVNLQARLFGLGEVAASAAILDQVGVPTANGRVMTLWFRATGSTESNRFDFADDVRLKICPSAEDPCDDDIDVDQPSVAWTGGTMTAVEL